MRHLLLVIALFGAGLLPARGADSPAQMVSGEDSIEERLLIPRKLEPGRYEVQCEAVIGVNGSARNVVCYSFTDFPAPRYGRVVVSRPRLQLRMPHRPGRVDESSDR